MCSELFRIPYQWGPIPIFGYGLLLVIWLSLGAITLMRAVRLHGWSAEIWIHLPVLFLIAIAIVSIPRLFPGGLPVRGYGLMLLLAAIAGVAIAAQRAEQMGINRDVIFSLSFWLFVCGILGARVFYVVEYWESEFQLGNWRETVVKVLNFPQGGLVIYGALIAGIVAFFCFTRLHRLPALAMADIVAPAFMIGLAIGRIGCLLNGCCYGGPSNLPWAVTFPPDSPPYNDQIARGEVYGFRLVADSTGKALISQVDPDSAAESAGMGAGDQITHVNGQAVGGFADASRLVFTAFVSRQPLLLETAAGDTLRLPAVTAVARSRPVHPTQVYSSINAALIGWFLWAYYPFRRRDGEILAIMLTIYPITRFVLEIIRTDESAVFGTGMSISQNISVAVIIGVLVGWILLACQPKKLSLPVSQTN